MTPEQLKLIEQPAAEYECATQEYGLGPALFKAGAEYILSNLSLFEPEASRSAILLTTIEKLAKQKIVAEIPETERDGEYMYAYDTFILMARDTIKKYNQWPV